MDYDTFLVVMAFGMVGAGLVHSAWLWLGQTRPSFVSIIDDGPRLLADMSDVLPGMDDEVVLVL